MERRGLKVNFEKTKMMVTVGQMEDVVQRGISNGEVSNGEVSMWSVR